MIRQCFWVWNFQFSSGMIATLTDMDSDGREKTVSIQEFMGNWNIWKIDLSSPQIEGVIATMRALGGTVVEGETSLNGNTLLVPQV